MFLLLAEKKLETLSQIKNLLDENRIECQVVNCSSSKVLLDLTKKLAPEVVMLDIDFILDSYGKKSDIVDELRLIKADTYIITLIDADNYQKLSKALEKDINDYLFKPLEREDAMLRINIGLQRNNPKITQLQDDDKAVVQNDVIESKEILDVESKDILVEIEDAFDEEIEQTGIKEPDQTGSSENLAVSDYDDLDTISELSEKQTEEDTLFEPETVPDSGGGEKPYEVIDNNFDDELPKGTFDSHYSADQNTEADKELFDEEKDQVESFLNAFDDEQIAAEQDQESAEEEVPPEAEPEGYIEDIESDEEYTPGEEVLEYYQVQPDNKPPESEAVDVPPKAEDKSATEHELSVAELESKVNLQEEQFMQIDDSELFGTEYKRQPVDTRFFEELFDKNDESGKKKKNLLAGFKAEKIEKDAIDDLTKDEIPLFQEKELEVTEHDERDEPGEPENPVNINDVFLRDEDKLIESPPPKKRKSKDKGKKGKGNRFTKFTGNLFMIVLLFFLFTLSFFLIQSRISGESPEIAGYKIFYVLSGSMKPAFDTGSVILVEPMNPLAVAEGDIITFSSLNDSESLTTHRVVGINRDSGLSFTTRGDANNTNDPNPVQPEQLIGRVRGSVPYVGYLLSFVQTREGLILLIFVPGFLILMFELRKIFGYLAEARAEKTTTKKSKKRKPEFDLGEKYNRETVTGEEDILL